MNERVVKHIEPLFKLTSIVAQLDLLQAFASYALRVPRACRPIILPQPI